MTVVITVLRLYWLVVKTVSNSKISKDDLLMVIVMLGHYYDPGCNIPIKAHNEKDGVTYFPRKTCFRRSHLMYV